MNGPLSQLLQGISQGRPDIILSALVVVVLLLLVCFPVHEFAHALVATKLGDDTPRLYGRVTLNPIAHLDLFGSILFLIFGFGWAKPVPVLPNRLNGNPRTSMAIVAFAGPASNVLLAVAFAILYRVSEPLLGTGGPVMNYVIPYALQTAVFLNLILALFNLIPIPPLDGSRILAALLPDQGAQIMDQLERYGFLVLMLVLVALPSLMSSLITEPAANVTRLLLGY
ncbi:MAG: site-2 protease family protein [Chloroflexi bacterium]|nr:site-2 protease family protein [Chloroflexota bacterium]MCL5273705.1 site-2 protease family protein [Chloroflexota bacterium]